MGIKVFKPTSPGRRGMTGPDFEELTAVEPERTLVEPLKKHSGRNNQGRVTTRHRGGGARRKYRIIDWKRDKDGIPGRVATIEYDPNRSARIALINYVDGEKRYIIAPVGIRVGDQIMSGPQADIKPGNALELVDIPVGTTVHNVELEPSKGAQMVRSAGTAAQLIAKEGEYATLRLPSGEIRRVHVRCRATIGQVSNPEHNNIKVGKAGRKRHMGWRPTVRGSAMAPNAHPHGGGEGKAPIGLAGPKTPWGPPALGRKTRGRRPSDKFIVRRRSKGRR